MNRGDKMDDIKKTRKSLEISTQDISKSFHKMSNEMFGSSSKIDDLTKSLHYMHQKIANTAESLSSKLDNFTDSYDKNIKNMLKSEKDLNRMRKLGTQERVSQLNKINNAQKVTFDSIQSNIGSIADIFTAFKVSSMDAKTDVEDSVKSITSVRRTLRKIYGEQLEKDLFRVYSEVSDKTGNRVSASDFWNSSIPLAKSGYSKSQITQIMEPLSEANLTLEGTGLKLDNLVEEIGKNSSYRQMFAQEPTILLSLASTMKQMQESGININTEDIRSGFDSSVQGILANSKSADDIQERGVNAIRSNALLSASGVFSQEIAKDLADANSGILDRQSFVSKYATRGMGNANEIYDLSQKDLLEGTRAFALSLHDLSANNINALKAFGYSPDEIARIKQTKTDVIIDSYNKVKRINPSDDKIKEAIDDTWVSFLDRAKNWFMSTKLGQSIASKYADIVDFFGENVFTALIGVKLFQSLAGLLLSMSKKYMIKSLAKAFSVKTGGKSIDDLWKILKPQLLKRFEGFLDLNKSYYKKPLEMAKSLFNVMDSKFSLLAKTSKFLTTKVLGVTMTMTNLAADFPKIFGFISKFGSKIAKFSKSLPGISLIIDGLMGFFFDAENIFGKNASLTEKLATGVANIFSVDLFKSIFGDGTLASLADAALSAFFGAVNGALIAGVPGAIAGALAGGISGFFGEEKVAKFLAHPIDVIEKAFADSTESLGTTVVNYFSDTIKKLFVLGPFGAALSSIAPDLVNNIYNKVTGFFTSILDAIKGKITSLLPSMPTFTPESSLGSVWDSIIGFFGSHSHKDGLDEVPYDNYPAILHQGERVLTKDENEDYSKSIRGIDLSESISDSLSGYFESKSFNKVMQSVFTDNTFVKTISKEFAEAFRTPQSLKSFGNSLYNLLSGKTSLSSVASGIGSSIASGARGIYSSVKNFFTGGSSGDVSGGKPIANFLSGKNISKEGIAGVIGNLSVESRLDPATVQDGFGVSSSDYVNGIKSGSISRDQFANDGMGFGLAQWTYPSRKAGLYDYLGPENIDSMSGQLEYLWKELTEGYPNVVKALQSISDVGEATELFMNDFENPGAPNFDKRLADAQAAYNSYDKGTPFVPEDQPANIHKGEAIIPKDNNPFGDIEEMAKRFVIDETRQYVPSQLKPVFDILTKGSNKKDTTKEIEGYAKSFAIQKAKNYLPTELSPVVDILTGNSKDKKQDIMDYGKSMLDSTLQSKLPKQLGFLSGMIPSITDGLFGKKKDTAEKSLDSNKIVNDSITENMTKAAESNSKNYDAILKQMQEQYPDADWVELKGRADHMIKQQQENQTAQTGDSQVSSKLDNMTSVLSQGFTFLGKKSDENTVQPADVSVESSQQPSFSISSIIFGDRGLLT